MQSRKEINGRLWMHKKEDKNKLEVYLVEIIRQSQSKDQTKNVNLDFELTLETSSFPKAIPQLGHFLCRLDNLSSIHSLQNK